MLNIRGSVSVEMIYVIVFLLALIFVVQRFILMGDEVHSISVKLENELEIELDGYGRDVCLEDLGRGYVDYSGEVYKRLHYFGREICDDE